MLGGDIPYAITAADGMRSELGCSYTVRGERIRAIMGRTIHTVGQADLTEEQWVTIALRNATES